MRACSALALVLLLAIGRMAEAYQADLVPGRRGPEAEDIEGALSITGEEGRIRVVIEGVNDAKGEPIDGDGLSVHLKVRVNGHRQRIVLPLTLDTGDGETTSTLGLTPGAQVILRDARVRGRDGRTLAVVGVVTEATSAATTTTTSTTLPLLPNECPAALAACQSTLATTQRDLTDCNDELIACEEICE